MRFRFVCFVLFVFLCGGPALAASLAERVEASLADYASAALPKGAKISIVDMTPVRGHVETVDITRFDLENGYFEATVANGTVRRRITGRAQTLVPFMAPVRTIKAGEKINAADFAEIMAPLSLLSSDALENVAAVEGYEARRSLAAGRPVSRSALGAPIVVERNDIVTVSYRSRNIRLTARARALEAGAVGDVIRAMHVDGGSVIEGVVSGPKAISMN